MDDFRVEWVKNLVSLYLNISRKECFDELLHQEPWHGKNIQRVLNGLPEAERRFFFYETVEEEEIEILVESSESEKVDVPVEKTETVEAESESSVSFKFPESDVDEKTADTEEELSVKLEEEEAEAADLVQEDKVSPIMEEVVPEEPEQKSPPKKFLKQLVKKDVLHLSNRISRTFQDQTYVYLLWLTPKPIPVSDSPKEAAESMPSFMEVGLINNHPLIRLMEVTTMVFLPVFKKEHMFLHLHPYKNVLNDPRQSVTHLELVETLDEFLRVLSGTVKQLERTSPFEFPFIPKDSTAEELAEDGGFIAQAEYLMSEWNFTISEMLKEILKNPAAIQDPLSAIDFWNERKARLDALASHLNHPTVVHVLEILQLAKCECATTFQGNCKTVNKHLVIAKDNADLLKILKPSLKNFEVEASLESSIKTIPSLLTLLRLIWIHSRYFGRSENMLPLMKAINVILQKKVTSDANVRVLFNKSLPEIKDTAEKCHRIMELWKHEYEEQQNLLKKTRCIHLWNFDPEVLFGKTDDIASVCFDISKIAEKLEQLHNLFESGLRELMPDPKKFDDLKGMVLPLKKYLQNVHFDIFDSNNKSLWRELLKCVQQDAILLEEDTAKLIQEIFCNLRSSQKALEFLQNFKNVSTSERMSEMIVNKHENILNQYVKEMYRIEKAFQAHVSNQSENNTISAIVSSITAVNHLFRKLKSPLLKFLSVEEIIITDQGEKAKEKYYRIAKSMKLNEKQRFELWQRKVTAEIPDLLLWTLLKNKYHRSHKNNDKHTEGNEKKFKPKHLLYEVNYPVKLEEITVQGTYLSHFGFKIPKEVLYVIYQVNELTYIKTKLNGILHKVHFILSSLNKHEASLVEDEMKKLDSLIHPGAHFLTWSSFLVPDFIEKCHQAAEDLEFLALQINSCRKKINSIIRSLSLGSIFDFSFASKAKLVSIKEFFHMASKKRRKRVEELVGSYRSLQQPLLQIEQLICNTVTGQAEVLRAYYYRTEAKILQALRKMMTLNLLYFQSVIVRTYIFPHIRRRFAMQGVVSKNLLNRIFLDISAFLNDSVKCTNEFIRWMDGTCIETEPQHELGQTKPLVYSFYCDLKEDQQINALALYIQSDIQDFLINYHEEQEYKRKSSFFASEDIRQLLRN